MTSKCSRSWVVCLSAALFFFYVFIQMNFFTAIEPLLFNKFHVGSAGIATLTSMYFYGNVLCLFPAGLILDRFSTKIVLLIVTAISVIATVLFGFAHTFVQAELTRIVMGAVGAFCLLAPVRLASRWFPAERMALVVGVIVTMAMLGGMVAQTPFTLLADAVGLIKTIYVDVVIGVVIWLMILFLVDDVPSGSEKADQVQHHQLGSLGLIGSISKVLAVRQNWLAGLYAALVNLPIFLLGGFWGSLYLIQMHHFSRPNAAFINGMLFFGMIVGSPVYGWWSDTIRKRKPPMVIGAIASLVLFAAIAYLPIHSYMLLVLLFFLFGFAISSQVIAYPLVVESNPLSLTGTAEGVASVLIMAGGFTVTLFAWMLNLHWNHSVVANVPVYSAADYRFGFSVMLIAFVAAFVIALCVRETGCQMQKQE